MEPSMTYPPGGDQHRGHVFLAVSLFTYALVLLSGGLRLITRGFIVHQMGWDDYTVAMALVLSTISTAFNAKEIQASGGRHVHFLTIPQAIEGSKYVDLAQLFLIVITCLTKVSICLFLMRIPNSKRLKTFIWLLIVGLIMVNSSCAIVFILQCRPMSGLWDPRVRAHCWSTHVYLIWGYFQGVFSVITDFICSSLPIAVLWNVQISRQTKIAICGLMAMGLLATACCVVRIALFPVILDRRDPTWSIIPIEIWALLEENVGLIAVNLPAMLPLYRYLHEKIPSGISFVRSYLKKPSSSNDAAQFSAHHEGFYRMEEGDKGLAKPGPRVEETVAFTGEMV